MSVQEKNFKIYQVLIKKAKSTIYATQKGALIHLVNISQLVLGCPELTLHTALKTTAQNNLFEENSRRK